MNTKLKDELLHRATIDQEMRNRVAVSGDISLWDGELDIQNTEYLERIVDELGWPTISEVGNEASHAAWLLVQHADHKPEFQARCLELLKRLSKAEVKSANIAYLEDRVRVAQGKPQLYGTQFHKVDGYLRPRPIQDEDTLEQRRAAMGLQTLDADLQLLLAQQTN